jgi:hypothetical protein
MRLKFFAVGAYSEQEGRGQRTEFAVGLVTAPVIAL